MNEKQKEVMDQYDIPVTDSYRSRGCLQLKTEQGIFMLTPYFGSPLRAACESELQKQLMEQGFSDFDEVIPNREGGFISYDRYHTPFILKRSFEGRECVLKEEGDIKRACKNLALLHLCFRRIEKETDERRMTPSIIDMLRYRIREIRRIRNYIRKSGRRTEFEMTFTSCYDSFYEESIRSLKWAETLPEEIWERGYGICHGAYHQHNVLMAGDRVITLNMDHYHFNQQILDLYGFLRKAMEKNQYQLRILEAGIGAYGEILPIGQEDHLLLYLLFSFPEKFWKISNQYYNTKKCFMPPKNLEKLKRIIEQNERRNRFLSVYGMKYLQERQ